MSKGILYVISGPSGTGKGTICEELLKKRNLHLSVSCTSRNKRVGEIEGINYYYTTPDNFKKMIEAGELLEWAVYNGNYYGTPRAQIEEKLADGNDVLLEIEPQGALNVKNMMPEAVLIFVVPPSMEILRDRLVGRGREDKKEIDERIASAKWEFTQAAKYNYIVENNILDECVNTVIGIMNNCTSMRNKIDELMNK